MYVRYAVVVLLLLATGCHWFKPDTTPCEPPAAAKPTGAPPPATEPASEPSPAAPTAPPALQPVAEEAPGQRKPEPPETPQPPEKAPTDAPVQPAATPVTPASPKPAAKPAAPAPRRSKPAAAPLLTAPPPAPEVKKPATPATTMLAATPTLDLNALKEQVKSTLAIGLFTKITLKNQVDDLLDKFRAYHAGKSKLTTRDLRRSYDLLLMKVLSLLQEKDPRLASAIVSSREAIWELLADPKKFATLPT